MNESVYQDFVRDLLHEIIEKTKAPEIYAADSFNRGYRSAIYAVLSKAKLKAEAFDIDPMEIGMGGFMPDEWFQQGQDYWKQK